LCAKTGKQTVDDWIIESCRRLSAFSKLRGCHIYSNATAPYFFKVLRLFRLLVSCFHLSSNLSCEVFFLLLDAFAYLESDDFDQ